MATLAEFRTQYPQYDDLSDDRLADGLYQKFYSDMPREDFNKKIGFAQPEKEDAIQGFLRRNLGDSGLNLINAPVRGAGNLIGQGIEGVSDAAKAGIRALGMTPNEDETLANIGRSMQGNIEKSVGHKGEEPPGVAEKLGEFAGQTLPFMAMGPAAGIATGATLFGGQGAHEQKKAAEESGADQAMQDKVTLEGFLPGAAMSAIPFHQLTRFMGMPAAARANVLDVAKRFGESAAIGGGATMAAQAVNNAITKNYKDVNLWEGVPEAGLLGAAVGTLAHTIPERARIKARLTPKETPEPAQETPPQTEAEAPPPPERPPPVGSTDEMAAPHEDVLGGRNDPEGFYPWEISGGRRPEERPWSGPKEEPAEHPEIARPDEVVGGRDAEARDNDGYYPWEVFGGEGRGKPEAPSPGPGVDPGAINRVEIPHPEPPKPPEPTINTPPGGFAQAAEQRAREPEKATPADNEVELGKGTYGELYPSEAYTQRETALVKGVHNILDQIAPGATPLPLKSMRAEADSAVGGSGKAYGAYMPMPIKRGTAHVIAWALDAGDPAGTVRHEAVHYLRRTGLIKEPEWTALEKAADKGDWLKQHEIPERYPNLDKSRQTEEAVAEQFSTWRRNGAVVSKLPTAIAKPFYKLRAALDRVGDFARRVLGKDVTANQVFSRIARGEVGERALPRPETANQTVAAQLGSRTHMQHEPEAPHIEAALDRVSPRDERPLYTRLFGAVGRLSPRERWEGLYAQAFDRYDQFRRRAERVHGKATLTNRARFASYDANKSALLSDRSGNLAVESLLHGPIEFDGLRFKAVGHNEGPHEFLFRPLAPTKTRNDLFRQFQLYAGAVRGQRLFQEGREHLYGPAELQAGQEMGQKYPQFKGILDRWIAYNNKNLDSLVASGYLAKPVAEKWKATGDYTPFYRMLTDEDVVFGPRKSGGLMATEKFKPLTGGKDALADPVENIMRNISNVAGAGMKNIAAQRAIRDMLIEGDATPIISQKQENMIKAGANGAARWQTITGGRAPIRASSRGDMVARIRHDGELFEYKLDRHGDFEAMSALNGSPTSTWLRMMAVPAQVLRTMTTKNPAFILLAHPLRESLQNSVISRTPMLPLIDTLRGTINVLRNSPATQHLKSLGVSPTYDYGQGDPIRAAKVIYRDLQTGGSYGLAKDSAHLLRSIWRWYDQKTEAGDLGTRQRIFERELATHGDEAEAAHASIDQAVNFQRRGSSEFVRTMATLVPFFNARLQGLDVLGRAMVQRPVQTGLKAMALMAMTGVYYGLMKDNPMYKNAPDYIRDGYFIWPVGDKNALLTPIPFEVGVLMKNIPEHIYRYATGADNKTDLGNAFWRVVMDTLKFDPLPQAIRPAWEAVSNHSNFTGRPVVPRSVEGLSPAEQYTTQTSETAKAFGHATGTSPVKVDHLIRGYLGTLGVYGIDAIDALYRLASNAPARPAGGLADTPIIKRFWKDNRTIGSDTLNRFYELKTEVDQLAHDVSRMKTEGRTDEIPRRMEGNESLLGIKKQTDRLGKQLAQLRKAEHQIFYDRGLSATEKRSQIDDIIEQRQAIGEHVEALRSLAGH